MASEALHCEAEESSASSAPAEMSGIEAAASSIDENPISASQQAHVSDAGADATQQNASDNGDGAASQAPSMRMPNANLCGVCEINPGKYKCSRCRLPYCSVPCSKAHQQNHPPDPPKEEPKPASQTLNAPPPAAAPLPPLSEHIDPSNPFSALATSDKLQLLFKKYPNLPNQLLEIHDATQPPPESPDAVSKAIPASLMKGLPASNNSGRGQWNHDIGIKNGKAALRKARKASGEDGEAIREYTELILHIMNETNDRNDAAAYVQRQIAEQDTALIERLLAEDRRNQ
ncbi:uncharacterized protein TrAFT101_005076 [Trichoderma asperellum]|nr:hypothetical protein TrAFT101_005076 [Trichoderma asperellum]